MKTPSLEHTIILNSLRRAVSKELDHKRRLGQYAVLWEKGRVVYTDGDLSVSNREPSSVREEASSYAENPEPMDKRRGNNDE